MGDGSQRADPEKLQPAWLDCSILVNLTCRLLLEAGMLREKSRFKHTVHGLVELL